MAIKPTINKPEFATAATGSDISEPTARKTTGFAAPGGLPEKPNRQELNFLLKSISEWTAYLESITDENLSFLNSTNDRFKEADDVAINLTPGYITRKNGAEWQASTNGNANEVVINDFDKAIFIGQQGKIFRSSVTSNTIITLTNADNSNPRYDLIHLDTETGLISFETGTPAAIPTKPAIPIGREGLCYVLRKATLNTPEQTDIEDIRLESSFESNDVYRTNASINTKEDSEPTGNDNQNIPQRVPFGTKFKGGVDQDKLRIDTVETIAVPAKSPEVVYTGSWATSTTSQAKYGDYRESSTAGDTAELIFYGVACSIAYKTNTTNRGSFQAEIAPVVNGIVGTYTNKTTRRILSETTMNNHVFHLYVGLNPQWWSLKITVIEPDSTGLPISYFTYVTHMIQKPVYHYGLDTALGGSATSVNDVPVGSIYWNAATMNKLVEELSVVWNSSLTRTDSQNAYFEYIFYGTIAYINIPWTTDTNIVATITIDDTQDDVAVNTLTPYNTTTAQGVWIRLSKPTLRQGWHKVKVQKTSGSAGQFLTLNGVGWKAFNDPSTLGRAVILGEPDIAYSDDSRWSDNGTTWSTGDTPGAHNRRQKVNTTNGEYTEITTPDIGPDLRAIYYLCSHDTNRGEVKFTLDGTQTKYLGLGVLDTTFGSDLILIYDSVRDGNLSNKVFRITNNHGNALAFEGVLFEKGNRVEDDHLIATPKWQRFANVTDFRSPTSNSLSIDVYGKNKDKRAGNPPFVHSGHVNVPANLTHYINHGIGLPPHYFNTRTYYNITPTVPHDANMLYAQDIVFDIGGNHPGYMRLNGTIAGNTYRKTVLDLNIIV